MIDLHRLRVLRSVAATGSVNRAATTLGYSPSAISQQLTALQRETGLRLVERQGRGISITAAGRALAAEAERVLDVVGGIDSLVGDLRSGRVGSLSIGYFASAGTAWIPAIVGTLVEEYPDLRLDLRLNDIGAGGSATADVEVLVGGTRDPAIEGYRLWHLLDDPYVAVLPAGHAAAGAATLALGSLAAERWVNSDPHEGYCRQVMLDACAQAGFVPQFRVEAPEYATAIAFVAAGVGVTVIPALGVGVLPAGVVTVPVVEPAPVRRILVGVRPAAERHPAAQRAVELLRTQVAAGAGSAD
ncbi:LysR family transcriptional regulator [Micromonosporaceae bacterium DT55]|uniref:LysR family transcriptional regulator n=1 Tax=Melissospora conviva TaxID=3388432 RepID=UPI003C25A165